MTDESLQHEHERNILKSGTAAAFPGMVRMSYWRYIRMFPKGTVYAALSIVLSLLLTIYVHILFGILLLGALAYLVLHIMLLRAAKSCFVSGCINPGAIVSLEPPLIAVATDVGLSGDCPVMKVLPHPIRAMTGGTGHVGQRIGTVASYITSSVNLATLSLDHDNIGNHWTDFDPTAIECGTSDAGEIKRVLDSITADRWEMLNEGLKQIPKPIQRGLYRIYPADAKPIPLNELKSQLPILIDGFLTHDPENLCYLASEGIPPEMLQKIAAVVDPARVLAVIGALRHLNVDAGKIMILAQEGIYHNFVNNSYDQIPYENLQGIYYNGTNFEITFRNGTRVHTSHTPNAGPAWELEALLNVVTGVEKSPL